MTELQFFDCNVQVGRSGYKHPQQIWRTSSLLDEMDRCGIAGALVTHGTSKTHSAMYGNRQLLDELSISSRLFGCWTVLPNQLGDFLTPNELIGQMRSNRIRAARMFPASHHFETDDWSVGSLLTALTEARIPLLLEVQETGWPQLADLLGRYPELPFVLLNSHWLQVRRLFPLMDRFGNLHLEFSLLQSNEIIEAAYTRYGANRLLFGSGMPTKSPGAARAFVDYARIPDEAKRMIAGGNLARLLGTSPPPAAMPDQDEITARASRGMPLENLVLDSHTHLVEDSEGAGVAWPMLRGDYESMAALYRTIGISKMSIAPWVGVNGGDTEAGNRIAEATRLKDPAHVEIYARIDPNYGEDVEAEARRWHVEKRAKGMKPYYQNERIKYTDKVYEPWWKLANELRLYALVDPFLQPEEEYVRQIDELAGRYPEVSLFMDHGGRSFEIAAQYAEIAKRHPHVYIQLTFTSVTLGVIEYLVGEVGADRILFGTDSPMRDPRPQVGWLAYANISFEDKKRIFGGNFQAILDRCLN